MAARTDTEWKGDEIKRRVIAAAIKGVNKTMQECVDHAKNNHPGWGKGFKPKRPRTRKLTGIAEGSVRIQEFARVKTGRIIGLWGSSGVDYVKWLELKHGRFLGKAADVKYRNLEGHISKAYKESA
jgi:hypothetical protein